MEIADFINTVIERPQESTELSRVQTMAKELAEGCQIGLWTERIHMTDKRIMDRYTGCMVNRRVPTDYNINIYLRNRWNDEYPSLDLLQARQYLDGGHTDFTIAASSFALAENSAPSTSVYIITDVQGGALPVALWAGLSAAGMSVYISKEILSGTRWKHVPRHNLEAADTILWLVTEHGIQSDRVLEEVHWALSSGNKILLILPPTFLELQERYQLSPEIEAIINHADNLRPVADAPTEYHYLLLRLFDKLGVPAPF